MIEVELSYGTIINGLRRQLLLDESAHTTGLDLSHEIRCGAKGQTLDGVHDRIMADLSWGICCTVSSCWHRTISGSRR